jgi:hypothetical protein
LNLAEATIYVKSSVWPKRNHLQKLSYYEGHDMSGIDELGKKIVMAGKLKLRPLCVYGTDEIPQGAMPSYAIDRCMAKAVFTAALYAETPPLYVDANQGQCCPGGLVWI